MKVENVTVEIHEKRNHPNAYGHYDARVSYTAAIEEGDDPASVVQKLQVLARQQAVGECDRWVTEVHEEAKREQSRNHLDTAIRRARSRPFDSEDLRHFEQDLDPLVASEQSEYRAKLLAAQEEYLRNLQNELDGHIDAAAKGLLSERGRIRFEQDLEQLPERERDDFRQRMEAAVASRTEAGADTTVARVADIDADDDNDIWDDDLDDDDDDDAGDIPL